MSAATHCPHCGVVLPKAEPKADAEPESSGEANGEGGGANFCPACGRKVAGWRTGARASLGGAGAGGVPLPGSDEPTRAVAPSPALLREAIAKEMASPSSSKTIRDSGSSKTIRDSGSSKTIRDSGSSKTIRDSEIAPSHRHRVHVLVGVVLVGLGLGLVVFLRPKPTAPPAITEAPMPPPAPAVVPTTPAAPVENGKKKPTARRITAPTIAPKPAPAPTAPAAKANKGGLPHKAAATDSRGAAATAEPAQAQGNAAPPVAAHETVEGEARPMTESERRADDAAHADADGVRFVVRSHLPQVQACYGRAFKDSSPGGRVDIGFVIGPNGRASKIHTESDSTGSPALAKCLEQRIAEWEFPRPSSGEFELVYPFVFASGS